MWTSEYLKSSNILSQMERDTGQRVIVMIYSRQTRYPCSGITDVLVYSGCHNKVPCIRWLKQQPQSATDLQAGKWVSYQGASATVFWWELLLARRRPPSICVSHGERGVLCVSSSLVRTPVPADWGSTLMVSFNLITSLKALSPNTVTWGVSTSTWILGDTEFILLW